MIKASKAKLAEKSRATAALNKQTFFFFEVTISRPLDVDGGLFTYGAGTAWNGRYVARSKFNESDPLCSHSDVHYDRRLGSSI